MTPVTIIDILASLLTIAGALWVAVVWYGKLSDAVEEIHSLATNHLPHLQASVEEVAKTNAELVELTRDVRDNIIKLVDRSERN